VLTMYLFVAGSIILLQCLSMIHKTGTNHRNDEMWRLLLLEQIPTFGEMDDKNTGPNHWKKIISPEICCRNVQIEIKLYNMTHTWCSTVIARSLNQAIRQRKALLSMGFGKISINFHVPSLNKCQLVSLIFKNTEWLS